MLTNQKATQGANTLLDLSFDYGRNNSVGNLNGKTGHLTKVIDNLNTNKNKEYEFDALGRLTRAKGGPTGNLWYQQYSYDRYGNRTNVQSEGNGIDGNPIGLDGIPNLSYENSTNRITTAGFQYDVAGNQIAGYDEQGNALQFEYDAANRIALIKRGGNTIQSFMYGSTNARLMDVDYTYGRLKLLAGVGGTVLSEYTEFANVTPTWTKSYTYLGDSQLATITPNGTSGGTVEYNHPDRLGTRLITNQAGGTSYEQAHLPFGKALDSETTTGFINSKRFTSYDRSAPTGLDYAVNRTYDSKQGRFTQVDPIGIQAASLVSPQTLNLYTYCGNDPVNYLDPAGLFFGKLFKWIGKIFKAIMKVLMWVVIVVAVVLLVAVVFAYLTPIMLPAFLGDIVGSIIGLAGTIAGGASSFVASLAGVIGIEVGVSLTVGGIISGALFGVGAIASEYSNNLDKKKKRRRVKRRPGLFQTVDQAAIWWLRIMNPHSIAINREIAVPICERQSDGAIIFGPHDIGDNDSSTVNDCPSGTKRVGSAHTHGAHDPAYDSENFSTIPGDRVNANNRSLAAGGSVPNYIGTPSGTIRKFKPAAIPGSARGKVITFKSKTPTVVP